MALVPSASLASHAFVCLRPSFIRLPAVALYYASTKLPALSKAELHTSPPTLGSFEVRRVPDFGKYKTRGPNSTSNKTFGYVILGGGAIFGTMAVKNIICNVISYLQPGAHVMATAKVEVDISRIPIGKNVTVKWRGKPVFIRHRSAEEISEAAAVPISELRHKQADSERTKKPEWLIMVGLCTHLGCVPMGESGEYNGWFCPCHGSHYDISGRIRKGPAPLNLEVPEYTFLESGKVLIG